jgi:hypothetical protein
VIVGLPFVLKYVVAMKMPKMRLAITLLNWILAFTVMMLAKKRRKIIANPDANRRQTIVEANVITH